MSAQHQDRPGENLLTPTEFKRYLEILKDTETTYAGRLNDWQISFASDMLERFERYGPNVRVSPKQKSSLDGLERSMYGT